MRIVYASFREEPPLIDVGLVIGYSLLTSYGIRRDTRVITDLVYRGVSVRLVVDGRRVRHLRMDADSLAGFVRRALQGKLRGVTVTRPSIVNADVCLYLEDEQLSIQDADVVLLPALRNANIVIFPGVDDSLLSCRHIVNVELVGNIVIWFRAGVVQMMMDRWLYGRDGGARGTRS